MRVYVCTITLNIARAQLYAIGKARPGGLFSLGKRAASGSVRHRCHISCELHDHHLDDAHKLHQAMLSNSALDIGSINLADMDPDEIQVSALRVGVARSIARLCVLATYER